MPVDGTGAYRHNDESARMHTRAAGMDPDKEESGGENVHELHDHGDGTFSTSHPEHGEMEHPTLGHALIHMASKHAEEGHKHFHAQHDGEMTQTHSAGKDEEPEHRDGGMEEAHGHMDEVMGDGQEGPGEENQGKEAMSGEGLGGLY